MPERVHVYLDSSADHDVHICRAGHGDNEGDDVTSRGRDGGGDPSHDENGGPAGDQRDRCHAYRDDLARGAGCC